MFAKITTDDCYTPPAVYEAIKGWVLKEYNLEGKEVVRPFYPGGDYENYNYPEDCVIIDNPPFSILSKIIDFYISKNIKFFLFAPTLTMFSSASTKACSVIADGHIEYENGAKVHTGFITNLDDHLIYVSNELRSVIKKVVNDGKTKMLKYSYPDNVVTSARLNKFARMMNFKIPKSKAVFKRVLDKKKKHKKAIYGSGYIISDDIAEKLPRDENPDADYVWELSEEEKKIVQELNACK